MSDWIGVDDRLPDENITVLVCDGDDVEMGSHNHRFGWTIYEWDGPSSRGFVTNWMPLPAPPEK